jgi:hypothetical protein
MSAIVAACLSPRGDLKRGRPQGRSKAMRISAASLLISFDGAFCVVVVYPLLRILSANISARARSCPYC